MDKPSCKKEFSIKILTKKSHGWGGGRADQSERQRRTDVRTNRNSIVVAAKTLFALFFFTILSPFVTRSRGIERFLT